MKLMIGEKFNQHMKKNLKIFSEIVKDEISFL